MATWDTTTAKSQAYQNGDIYNVAGVEPKRITDKKDGETTFTVGEEVTLHYKTPTNVLTGTATYKGTITVNGVIYPVVEYELGDDTITYVVGLPFGSSDNPTTIGSHNINAVAFTVCFLPGTLISTPSGERKVEELVAGDSILIGDAGGRLERTPGCGSPPNPTSTIVVPVKWVGRQTVSTQFGPADRLIPVRFAAGSLEGGGGGQPLMPHSDLTVTADHAMLVDGVLCEAGALVNGTTIIRVPLSELGDSYTVYHVETEAHEILIANGAPSETFVDNVSRRAFDNSAEFVALYGEHPPEMVELPYPRASNVRNLPERIKRRLGIGPPKPAKTA